MLEKLILSMVSIAYVTAAKMVKIDALGMDLNVQANGATQPMRIAFNPRSASQTSPGFVTI
jgi:putative heme iron utilization protein